MDLCPDKNLWQFRENGRKDTLGTGCRILAARRSDCLVLNGAGNTEEIIRRRRCGPGAVFSRLSVLEFDGCLSLAVNYEAGDVWP